MARKLGAVAKFNVVYAGVIACIVTVVFVFFRSFSKSFFEDYYLYYLCGVEVFLYPFLQKVVLQRSVGFVAGLIASILGVVFTASLSLFFYNLLISYMHFEDSESYGFFLFLDLPICLIVTVVLYPTGYFLSRFLVKRV